MSNYGFSSNNLRFFGSPPPSSNPPYYSSQTNPASVYPSVDQTSPLEHHDGQSPVHYGPTSQPYLVTGYPYVATTFMHHPDQPHSSTSSMTSATWPVSAPFASAASPSTPFNHSPVAPSSAPSAPSPEVPSQLPVMSNNQQFYTQNFPETEATSSPNQFRMPPGEQVYESQIYSATASHSHATEATQAESLGGPNIALQYTYQTTGHTGAHGNAYAYVPAVDQPGVWPAPSQDNRLQMPDDGSLFQARSQAPSRHTLTASGDSSLDYSSYPPTPNPSIEQPTPLFRGFPDSDTSRDLTYKHPYDDQANTQLLKTQVHDAPCTVDVRHRSLVPATRSASPPTAHREDPAIAAGQVMEQQQRRPSPPASQYFSEPTRQCLAVWLLQQDWVKENQEEPSISSVEEAAVRNLLAAADSTCRFDLLFEKEGKKGKFKCLWLVDGKPCNHESERQERARGHARYHFDYRPYPCEGACGKPGCQEQYICQSSRSDHARRKHRPKRPCSMCNVEFSAQNLRRHMKVHEQSRHEQSGSSPPDTRPSKKM